MLLYLLLFGESKNLLESSKSLLPIQPSLYHPPSGSLSNQPYKQRHKFIKYSAQAAGSNLPHNLLARVSRFHTGCGQINERPSIVSIWIDPRPAEYSFQQQYITHPKKLHAVRYFSSIAVWEVWAEEQCNGWSGTNVRLRWMIGVWNDTFHYCNATTERNASL